ncbi:glycosyltransferase [Cetobacterium sp.]|uniref:glycosyltransferase n=1 Tax=Cetobacterium sp. TaxID=2071632 RepID=UPI003F3263A5
MVNIRDEFIASIIVPAYNNESELRATLISIVKSNFDLNMIEILVCDDGSEKSLINVVKDFDNNINIRYFYQQDRGFRAAAARNMGILNAKGHICIFIDSGIIVSEECIAQHIMSHEVEHIATIGYVYGFDNTNELETQVSKLVDIDNIEKSILNLENNKIFDMREDVYREMGDDLMKWPAPWCYFWGGNISIEKEDLLNVNGFDESYIEWGGEDVDLGIALFLNGVKLTLCRKANSIHLPHKKVHNMVENFDDFKANLIKTRLKLYEKYKLSEILIWTKVLNTKKFNKYLLENVAEWKTI